MNLVTFKATNILTAIRNFILHTRSFLVIYVFAFVHVYWNLGIDKTQDILDAKRNKLRETKTRIVFGSEVDARFFFFFFFCRTKPNP